MGCRWGAALNSSTVWQRYGAAIGQLWGRYVAAMGLTEGLEVEGGHAAVLRAAARGQHCTAMLRTTARGQH